jgi:hypothetical protein
MALRFDWGQLNEPALTEVVLETINGFLHQQRGAMQGGFAFMEILNLGDAAPKIMLLSLSSLDEDGLEPLKAKLHFSFVGDCNIKLHAYAQINTVRSRGGKVGDRGRLLMRSLDSFAPAFLNVWVQLCRVAVKTDVVLTLDPATQVLQVHLSKFPLDDVLLSTCFNGSVISDKIVGTINEKLEEARAAFAANGHNIQVPLTRLQAQQPQEETGAGAGADAAEAGAPESLRPAAPTAVAATSSQLT